jgi:hypothetical protein
MICTKAQRGVVILKKKLAVLATEYGWNRTKVELKLVCIRFLAMLQPVEIAKQRGISIQKFIRAVIVQDLLGDN